LLIVGCLPKYEETNQHLGFVVRKA
jgi:hypothetical protein